MGRMEAVQFLAKSGAKLELTMPDGTKRNAIDAARIYPKIQQWLCDFYGDENQSQGSGSECVESEQETAPLGSKDGEHLETSEVRRETIAASI